jgi:hypothetical protein
MDRFRRILRKRRLLRGHYSSNHHGRGRTPR